MNEQKLSFLQNEVIPLVQKLNGNETGSWGKMNAQQMVEHVTAFFKVSTGKIQFPLVTPVEHLPKYREFLLSEKEFRPDTKAPLEVIGEEALPLRHENMEAAVAGLQKSITEFVDHFKNDPDKKTLHPVFGELNFEDWVLLHYKHVMHHAKQFGLM
ncbi:MAG: DUF1569 domain-containing protein [Ferruginibacter sp.]